MALEHPIQLSSEQHRAFAEKVVWQTVGIVNCMHGTTLPMGPAQSDGLGTGSACRWKERQIILTAKHVIEGAVSADLRFFLRSSGQVEWNTRSESPAFFERVELAIERIVMCRRHDLAAIVLNSRQGTVLQLHFCELPNSFGELPPPGSGVLLAGYPSDQAISMGTTRSQDGTIRRALAVKGQGHWGIIVHEPPSYFPSSYDPVLHFLISFDPAEEGSMPHGFSGTGVWYQEAGSRPIWTARPVLAGVQTGWHRQSKLMTAIRAEFIREFLEKDVAPR